MADIKRAAREATEFQGETRDQQGGGGFVPSDLFKRASSVVHVSSEVQEATSQWKLGVPPPAPEISNSSTAGSEISGKRKRKSDSSEEEAAAASLKPYECRFCPMKFAKSQALGGHMNRHRQEREREQLLHARQLVLQQGLPWVTGSQNPKLQRSASDCFNSSSSRISSTPPSAAATFQLSQSLNISNHVVLDHHHHQQPNPPDDGGGGMQKASYCAEPYIVQHDSDGSLRGGSGGAAFPGDDVLVMPSTHAFDSKVVADILGCSGSGAAGGAAAGMGFDRQHSLESVKSHDEEQQHQHQQQEQQHDHFPSLQLGPCSSDMISSSPLNHLEMAVDFEQHHQLLSLGGYSVSAFEDGYKVNGSGSGNGGGGGGAAMAEIMAGPLASQCDGLSWIFSNSSSSQKSCSVAGPQEVVEEVAAAAVAVAEGGGGGGGKGGSSVSSQDPSYFLDGFGLALGHSADGEDGNAENDDGAVEKSHTTQES